MQQFVVGVDGGTTKTVALVADTAGRIIGAARGGGSNWTGSDVSQPMRVVIATAVQALERAGVAGTEVALGVFGLAGADWLEDYARRQAMLAQSGLARRVVVKNDALVGWRAGTREPYGLVIAAGTGLNVCVITPDGREWCYGYYARYGGASDITAEAIDAVLRAEDGRGAPTALTDAVLSALGYASTESLLRGMTAGRTGSKEILPLCPAVFEAAQAGDQVAADILVHQGLALAEYVTAAVSRFGMRALAFDVVLCGSVFKGVGPLLVDTITQAIHRVAPRARVTRARLEPVVGALLFAYDELGILARDALMRNLEQSVPGDEFFSTVRDLPADVHPQSEER
jgi:N-acetylglucosamine kinase-like BadF-type ATPase